MKRTVSVSIKRNTAPFEMAADSGRGGGQTCKACGRRDKFDFHIPDSVWLSVVPAGLSGLVVCMACFDEFAAEKGVDYAPHLRVLYFAGNRAVFEFRAVRSFDLST